MLYLGTAGINHAAIAHMNKRRSPGAPVPFSTALALIGFLIFCCGISAPGWPLAVNQAFARTPALTNDPILSLFRPYTAPKGDLMEYFAMEHAPIYDTRMAEGLVEAIGEYARLFPAGQAGKVAVTYSQTQISVNDWLLAYDIKAGAQSAKVELTLTTDPDRIASNIPAMAKALAEAVEKMKGLVKPPAEIKLKKGDAGKIAARAMAGFDNASFIGALNDLGAGVSADSLEPEALLEAGNLFSWLCYFKSIDARPNQGRIIGPQALANHLVSGLFIKEGDERLMRARGLLLLGLGYPAAAMTTMAGLPHVERELAYVMAARDLDQLDRAAKASGASPRLASYLDARLTNDMHGYLAASKKFETMALSVNKTGFEGQLIVSLGGVPMARYAEYLLNTNLIQHFSLMENYAQMGLKIIKPLSQTVIGALSGKDSDSVNVALKLHADTLGAATGLKQGDRILTFYFLADYLNSEAQDWVYLCFLTENDVYGRLESARSWASVIENAWPESSLSQLATISLEIETNQYKKIQFLVKTAPINHVNAAVLMKIAWFHLWDRESHKAIGDGVKTLQAIRQRLDPSPANMVRIGEMCQLYFLTPACQGYFSRAVTMDPNNPRLYYSYLPRDAENLIQDKGHALGKSELFLEYAARGMAQKGRTDEAIAIYRRLLALGGKSSSPAELAILLKRQNKYAEAERLMKEHIKNDDGSFNFVDPKNTLAQIYLKQNKNQEAFDLMKVAKDSWQAGALINYARAAELLGKLDLAEKYFGYAAERYPAGFSPVYLAMFHLRQGERQKAVATLKQYKTYNHYTYYFKKAVAHFSRAGAPEEITKLISEVEGSPLTGDMVYGLHWALMDARQYAMVAKLTRPFIKGNIKESPAYHAINYINATAKANPAQTQDAIAEVKKALSDKPILWGAMAMLLHKYGYYGEAFELFREWGDHIAKRRDDGTLMMAASWKALGDDPALRPVIENRLQFQDIEPGRRSLIGYYLGDVSDEQLRAGITEPGRAVLSFYAMAADRISKGQLDEADKLMVLAIETGESRYLMFGYAYEYLKSKSKVEANGVGVDDDVDF